MFLDLVSYAKTFVFIEYETIPTQISYRVKFILYENVGVSEVYGPAVHLVLVHAQLVLDYDLEFDRVRYVLVEDFNFVSDYAQADMCAFTLILTETGSGVVVRIFDFDRFGLVIIKHERVGDPHFSKREHLFSSIRTRQFHCLA